MGTGITAYWAGKLVANKHRVKEKAKRAKRKANNLPKVFDYYCPHCLFQTIEYMKICPQCRSHRLEKTTDEKY